MCCGQRRSHNTTPHLGKQPEAMLEKLEKIVITINISPSPPSPPCGSMSSTQREVCICSPTYTHLSASPLLLVLSFSSSPVLPHTHSLLAFSLSASGRHVPQTTCGHTHVRHILHCYYPEMELLNLVELWRTLLRNGLCNPQFTLL